MADIGKIEYRVRPITRWQVTRYHESADGRAGGTEQRGEYDNADVAYEVGYALCKEEHRRLGFPAGDDRIQYPENPRMTHSVNTETIGALSLSTGAKGQRLEPSSFDNSDARK